MKKKHPLEKLLEFLFSRKILLVLDNLEHLPEAGMLVSKMLSRAPGLRILATSRTRLMLNGEHLFPLSGLPCPDMSLAASETIDNLKTEKRYDAVGLFLSAARMLQPDIKNG